MAGEKRNADDAPEELHQESAILLDVEGTTSSISFVQDTLFPYIREFLKKHVDEKWADEEFKADFAKLKEQAKEDEEKKVDGFVPIKEDTEEEAKETLIKNVLWQMDNDRKTGALKQLQGHMWKAAHKPIKGHVYDDVPKAFEEWTNMGKKLYIYSSGSVEAQKLLYGDSVHGNLLKYISGHFDTTIGPKQEANSYKNILKEINLEPSKVLFLTDVVKEAQAAKEAGLSTSIVIREGNAKLNDEDKAAFKTIESFAEIIFEAASKRQKIDDANESKKKDAPKEDEVVSKSTENEPMDTSEVENVIDKEKKTDTTADVVESNVEKVVETEKIIEEKESEKTITPMEKDTKSEEKTVADAKTENVENGTEEQTKVSSSEEKKNIDTSDNVEKKSTKLDEKQTTETEESRTTEVEDKQSVEVQKESEKVSLAEENTLHAEVPKKTENESEEVTEKVTEEVTEKIVDETAKAIEKEAKSEEKEVKENGESKTTESEQNSKTSEGKVDETENKENVQSANVDDKIDAKVEVAEEAKETTTVENAEDSEKSEKEKEKVVNVESVAEKVEGKTLNGTASNGDLVKSITDEKVHSNGINEVSEKIKETDESEESIKIKKAVADGAGEADVVAPPVVAATS